MSMYVFAPAGPQDFQNNLLRIAIEFIGLHEKGCGSSWAKGKRYLKGKLSCSGMAIKRACMVKNKYINHDYEEYGAGVYYYQKDDCVHIVETVINYLVEHQEDDALPQIFYNCDFQELLVKIYGHRISQVEWVRNIDYKGQSEAAEMVCESLNKLC